MNLFNWLMHQVRGFKTAWERDPGFLKTHITEHEAAQMAIIGTTEPTKEESVEFWGRVMHTTVCASCHRLYKDAVTAYVRTLA